MIDSSTSGETKVKRERGDAPLDRVLRALNHPIRRGILRVLVDGNGSAKSISKELGLTLGVVSYHLSQVLAKECEVVELVETIPRRGAIEKFYRLRLEGLAEEDRKDADGPAGMRRMSLEECFIVAAAAMDSEGFGALEGSGWKWFLTQVDDAGWREVREASADFNQRVQAAVEGSRGSDGSPHEVVVGVAAFPAAPPSPAS